VVVVVVGGGVVTGVRVGSMMLILKLYLCLRASRRGENMVQPVHADGNEGYMDAGWTRTNKQKNERRASGDRKKKSEEIEEGRKEGRKEGRQKDRQEGWHTLLFHHHNHDHHHIAYSFPPTSFPRLITSVETDFT